MITETENKEAFFARLEGRLAPSEITKVKGAYIMSKFGHRAQQRMERNGDGNRVRYFEHCRRTALIAMDDGCYDPDVLCTCLLHDCLEDTKDITADVIEHFFGPNVARLVSLLTHRDDEEGPMRLREQNTFDALRVKAYDRLDNVRSLFRDGVPKEFRVKKARETRDVYVPLFEGSSLDVRGSFVLSEMGELIAEALGGDYDA
jgi:(p)ppGpp synthase/HD superfamily hydrolase